MTSGQDSPPACHNCGGPLHGRFCANCGQEDQPLDPSVREVVREVARELSALDGRILRSMRRLFLSPGFLTLEHFAGRRVGWVSPVRLYLIFSVCYFAIVAMTGEPPLEVNLRFTSDNGEENMQAIRSLGFSSKEELDSAVNEALTTWIPRAMFVLVPLFGWLVSLVRRRSGHKYPHHVIFACHVFAVFFGVQAIAVGIGFLSGNAAVTSALAIASLVFAFVSMILAMRAVYGGTIMRASAHTLVVLAFYWLATIVVAAAIIAPVLFWK